MKDESKKRVNILFVELGSISIIFDIFNAHIPKYLLLELLY